MPSDQNIEEVFHSLNEDCGFICALPLLQEEKTDAINHIHTSFLQGSYPIIIGTKDPASRDVMRREIQAIAEERSPKSGMDMRSTAIAVEMERYRQHLAEGLDHESQEIQRREESRNIDLAMQKEFEETGRQYHQELEFIHSLNLPEFEAKDWPRVLQSIAQMRYLKVDDISRAVAHNDIRELIQNLPKDKKEYFGDPWGVVTNLIYDYWNGRYKPDATRRLVLDNEIKKLELGESASLYNKPLSTFYLRKSFIEGSKTKNSLINSSQDSILMGRAYQRDIQIIRNLGLDAQGLRQAEWEYNDWLLQGKLPLFVANETEADRIRIEQKLMAEKAAGHIVPISILQHFCDYWYEIAGRSK